MFSMAARWRGVWRTALGPVAVAGLVVAMAALRPGDVPEVAAQPAAAAAAPSSDLALVPADAVGFVHVRLVDVWKHDLFASFRKTWERAGQKAIGALDQQFVPAPSSLDRLTAFVVLDDKTKEPRVFGAIAFSAPFDPAQVAKLYLPRAQQKVVGRHAIYTDANMGVAVTFPDNKTALIGEPGAMEAYLGRKVTTDGPMAGAIKLAATRPVVAAANVAKIPIPHHVLDQVPAEFRPLLKTQLLLVSLDLGAEVKLDVRATYADEAAAGDAEKALRALVSMGRKELGKHKTELEAHLFDPKIKTPRPPGDLPEAVGSVLALGALGQIDDLLADPKLIARDGKDIVLGVPPLPKELVAAGGAVSAVGVGLLLPAVQKVRQAASRTSSQNNLKQIGLAIWNYEAAYGKLPADITDKNGKPILSWRVAILPFIEQDNLYKQFKLDEPWDSPNNKPLSQSRIKVFMSPQNPTAPELVDKDGYGLTSYKGVSGPGAFFEPGKAIKVVDITDGTSNTIAVVEAGDPIPWAKPGDFPFDPKKPLPKLVSPGMGDMFNALLGDGSVRVISSGVAEKTLKAAFTRNGGEILGPDW